MKILVVDDKSENRYMLESMLRSSGYDVVPAINGVEALEKLHADTFDLIISDILMPRMDGFMFIRECKTDPVLNKIPFIFYTASYTSEKDREFGMSLGAEQYILKPIEPDEFLEIIKKTVLSAPSQAQAKVAREVRDEEAFFETYNSRLVHKLEEKIGELQASKYSLEESESELRFLFDTMTEGVLFLDSDGIIIRANKAAEDILGLPFEQMQGRTSTDERWHAVYEDGTPFPGERHPAVQALDSGRETTGVMGVYNPSEDDYRWIDIHSVPQFHPGETAPFGVYSRFRDVTLQKKIRKERELHSKRIEELLELHRIIDSPEQTIMVRAIDASLVITSSAYGFIGLVSDDESKLVVHAWSEGVMKNCTVPSMPVHFNISGPFVWGECIRQRKAVIINNFDDYPAKHGFPGGHVAIDHFMAVPVFDMGRIVAMCAVANKEEPYTSDDAGTLTTLGNTVWEIMHRKQSAEALRKREAQLLEAQRLARLGNIDYDVTGNYLSLSDEGLRILGIQAEEFQGTLDDYYSRIHPDDLDQVKTMYTTCIESGGREIFEHRILRPGGEERYVQVRFRTVKEPGGTVTYCSGTIQDITDRKLTEKQLEVSILRITQNLEQMAILNDQIRNPLSVITAITDLEDGQYKQKILSAVREINDLITRLDQGWLESDKVRKFLKTHYGFYEESG